MLNRIALLFVGLGLVVFASACGGGSGDVPEEAVAVVDGTEISRAELDELVARAKKAYEAQNQEFPKVGTPEHQSVQTQYVAFLVQREEFEKEAAELGLQVSEKDVDKEVRSSSRVATTAIERRPRRRSTSRASPSTRSRRRFAPRSSRRSSSTR